MLCMVRMVRMVRTAENVQSMGADDEFGELGRVVGDVVRATMLVACRPMGRARSRGTTMLHMVRDGSDRM